MTDIAKLALPVVRALAEVTRDFSKEWAARDGFVSDQFWRCAGTIDELADRLHATEARAMGAEAERDAALAVAYLGDGRFPDQTWKARCAEEVAARRAAEAALAKEREISMDRLCTIIVQADRAFAAEQALAKERVENGRASTQTEVDELSQYRTNGPRLSAMVNELTDKLGTAEQALAEEREALLDLRRAANAVAHIDTGGPPYSIETLVSSDRLQDLAAAIGRADAHRKG